MDLDKDQTHPVAKLPFELVVKRLHVPCAPCQSESTSASAWKKPKSKKNRNKNTDNPVCVVPSNFTQNPLEFIHCHQPENIDSSVEGFDINNPPDLDVLGDELEADSIDYMNNLVTILLSYLFAPIIKLHEITRQANDWICMVLSKGTASTSDEDCLYRNMISVVIALIGIFVFYNWFFILCYRDDDNVAPSTWDTDKINISWSWLQSKSFMVGFILKYVVCHVSFLHAVLMKIKQNTHRLGAQICFMALYPIILFIMSTYGESIIKLLQTAINRNLSDNASSAFIGYAFIFAAYTMMQEASTDTASFMTKFSSIVMAVGTFILFVMRMLFSITIMWVAAILIPVYLIVFSLGGMFLFSKHNLTETIKRMNNFIVKGYEPPPSNKYNKCRPRKWTEWFIETFNWITNITSRYYFEYIIAGVLLSSIYDYYQSLGGNQGLCDVLVALTWFMIVIIVSVVVSKIFKPAIEVNPITVANVKNALGVPNVVTQDYINAVKISEGQRPNSSGDLRSPSELVEQRLTSLVAPLPIVPPPEELGKGLQGTSDSSLLTQKEFNTPIPIQGSTTPPEAPRVELPPTTPPEAPHVELPPTTPQEAPHVELPPTTPQEAPHIELPPTTPQEAPHVELPPTKPQEAPHVELPPQTSNHTIQPMQHV